MVRQSNQFKAAIISPLLLIFTIHWENKDEIDYDAAEFLNSYAQIHEDRSALELECWPLMATTASAILQRLLAVFAALSAAYERWQVNKRAAWLLRSIQCHVAGVCRWVLAHSDELAVHAAYYVTMSFFGFLILSSLELRRPDERPSDGDFFFTAASAVTVSSMSVVEMEVFSNSQLLLLTVLMLAGGEVIVSIVGLLIGLEKVKHQPDTAAARAMRYVFYTAVAYVVLVHVLGMATVVLYMRVVATARAIIDGKGIDVLTFALFTVVSTFSSCGFLPTNENMAVFAGHPGLLLLVAPLSLVGNTLFPAMLRLCVWAAGAATGREELRYALSDDVDMSEVGFRHLLPLRRTVLLSATVAALVVAQVAAMCLLDWGSRALQGLSAYEKAVNVVFTAVNTRHAGESSTETSALAPALLVLFIVMMYLPPYTTFMPFEGRRRGTPAGAAATPRRLGWIKGIGEVARLPQLSYLVIFVTLVCITERESIARDPLNFNVLSIAFEVVSAYGNVGLSLGYSCSRRRDSGDEGQCVDSFTGFAGRWSGGGKVILVVVMFFGRLKKFTSINAGNAWILS